MVERANRTDFFMDACHLWDNDGGGAAFRDIVDSDLYILNGAFRHNRGTTLYVDKISGKTNILVQNNQFLQNRFQNNMAVNSVVELETTDNSGGM